jgi:uncharacterized membrane protein
MKPLLLLPFALLVTTTSALAQQKPGQTELILCNKTQRDIDIALAYQDAATGRWTLSAWHKRTPGECKSFGAVKTGLFYYHAKNGQGGVWPASAAADRQYCVPTTAVRREMSSQCGQGETNRPFKERKMEGGKYTFNFN